MDRGHWNTEFLSRFCQYETELEQLFFKLYHQDAQAYASFADMLHRCYEERPETLRVLDRQRLAEPDWYKGHSLVGMLMYVNAFADLLSGEPVDKRRVAVPSGGFVWLLCDFGEEKE